MHDMEAADRWQEANSGRSARQVFYADGERRSTGTVRAILGQLGVEVMEFDSTVDCINCLKTCECHLLVNNARRPYIEGMELLRSARRVQPSVPVIVLVDHGDIKAAARAIKGGATNCLERPVETERLSHVIDELLGPSSPHAGHSSLPLTPTETTVLRHILEGETTRQIAKTLCRSPRTIEVHRSAIMHKLEVDSMVALVKKCIRLGLLSH